MENNNKPTFKEKSAEWWRRNKYTVISTAGSCMLVVGGYLIGVSMGYAFGLARNPKVEVNYCVDKDGKLLASTITNRTGKPLPITYKNNGVMFSENLNGNNIAQVDITDDGASLLDAIPDVN